LNAVTYEYKPTHGSIQPFHSHAKTKSNIPDVDDPGPDSESPPQDFQSTEEAAANEWFGRVWVGGAKTRQPLPVLDLDSFHKMATIGHL